MGPDFDFGSHPVLHTLPNGRPVLTAGQKSGIAWGLDPRSGEVVWEQRAGATGSGDGDSGRGLLRDTGWRHAGSGQVRVLAANDSAAKSKG